MIVCSCHVIRDDEIRSEVRLGATTVDEVGQRCGAGMRCGGCRHSVECLVIDEIERAARSVAVGTRD